MGSYRVWKAWFRQFVQSFWLPLILVLILLAAAVAVQRYFQKKETRDALRPGRAEAVQPQAARAGLMDGTADSLKKAVEAVLTGEGLAWKTGPPDRRPPRWTVEVPARIPVPSVHQRIQEALLASGGQVLSAISDPSTGNVELRTGIPDSCLLVLALMRAKATPAESGRIVVVIDDFGDRHDSMVDAFLSIRTPLTVSVLAGRRYSASISREAAERGHEVLLHLMMEPLSGAYKDDGSIVLKGMTPSRILEVVERSLADVPGAVGVNNHMGSKATQDRATMAPVLQVLSERGLFFMDSYTIASSVAYPLADEMGVRTARRDVFLDVAEGEAEIRKSLWTLARRAGKEGGAIGIGHCHRAMLEALREEIPNIEAKGYRFVFLSELVQ
jgi:polysaccharide deacetylase 2 family uncharacterized protein YibQ